MAIIYKWKCEINSIHQLEQMQERIREQYQIETKNNKIKVSFYNSREYTKYHFCGKVFKRARGKELKGVFYTCIYVNYILLVLSAGSMFSLLQKFPPVSLINIICDAVFLLILGVMNLVFFLITISSHNWSLYFYEDREKFLKIIDSYMMREKS